MWHNEFGMKRRHWLIDSNQIYLCSRNHKTKKSILYNKKYKKLQKILLLESKRYKILEESLKHTILQNLKKIPASESKKKENFLQYKVKIVFFAVP